MALVLNSLYIFAALTAVKSEFLCPTLSPCTCREDVNWQNGNSINIVDCSTNSLTEVPDLSIAFADEDVDQLLLNLNNITELSEDTFLGPNIKFIDLSNNEVVSIDNDTFSAVQGSLQKLRLEKMDLVLDNGLSFLYGLESLTELGLSLNTVQNEDGILPPNLFANLSLKSLTKLALSSCDIFDLDDGSFIGIETLEELDLSFNDLEGIPAEITRLANLKKLNLYGNAIVTLEDYSFAGLVRLTTLDFGANAIKTVEKAAFDRLENSLEELKFYDDELTAVPTEALQSLKKLSSLDLSNNYIEALPGTAFKGEYHLKSLQLSGNDIEFEEHTFTELAGSLEKLSIREMRLTSLPLSLQALTNIHTLDASYNQIEVIDSNFFGALQLSYVFLMGNKINTIFPEAFRGMPQGLGLDLNGNNITSVSFLLDGKPCLFDYVDLSENFVTCDCIVEKVINSRILYGPLLGECRTSSGVVYTFDNPELINFLIANCGETKRAHMCYSQTRGEDEKQNNNEAVSPTSGSCVNTSTSMLAPFIVIVLLMLCR